MCQRSVSAFVAALLVGTSPIHAAAYQVSPVNIQVDIPSFRLDDSDGLEGYFNVTQSEVVRFSSNSQCRK